jgi:hypothetical protein
VQKLSGNAAVASSGRPRSHLLISMREICRPNAAQLHFNTAKQGNQGRAQRPSQRSLLVGLYNPEKFRMECVGKTCSPLTESAACRTILLLSKILFSGAGEGIRTPDPLITNQMLYRLSYASKFSG